MLDNMAIFIPSKQSLKNALPSVKALNIFLVSLLLCFIFSGYLPFIAVFGEQIIPFEKSTSFLDYAILFPLVLLVLLGAPLKIVRTLAIAIPVFFVITHFETTKEIFNLVVEYLPEILKFSQSNRGADFGSLASSMITVKYGLFVYLSGVVGYLIVIIGFRYKENDTFWNRLFLRDDAMLVNRAKIVTIIAWMQATLKDTTLLVIELKNSDKAQAKEIIKSLSAKKITILTLFCGAIIALVINVFAALFFSPKMSEEDVRQAITDAHTQTIWGVKTTVDIYNLSISNCEQYSDSPIGIECDIKAIITQRRGTKVIDNLHVNEKESFQLENERWVYYD